MKILFIGDSDYGDRDRDTDALYQAISLVLRTNAVRNHDDLTLIYANDDESYFDSVVKQITDHLAGPIQVTPVKVEAEHLDESVEVNDDGSLDTELKVEVANPAEVYRDLDPAVDAIAFFSHDLLASENRKLAEQVLADNYQITWADGYSTRAIPSELYPDGKFIPGVPDDTIT